MKDERRQELAQFLQSRRRRLSPAAAGLPEGTGAKRRTAGLRREEVAVLAGISLPWYTALEQGRDIKVSEQVLESLARTLQLDRDERLHLYALMNRNMPLDREEAETEVASDLQKMLDGWTRLPAYLLDDRLNVAAWNQAAESLFGAFPPEESPERNLLWRLFTREEFRSRFVNWEGMARKLLAQFRTCYARKIDDPWYGDMIDRLGRESTVFSDWWADHDVRCPLNGQEDIRHPREGVLRLQSRMLAEMGQSGFYVVVYMPATGDDAEKLDRLRNIRRRPG